MALNHRQFRLITREMLGGWIATWRAMAQPKPTLRNYIAQQIDQVRAGWSTEQLDTSARDDYPDDQTPLMQVIMDDIRSYG